MADSKMERGARDLGNRQRMLKLNPASSEHCAETKSIHGRDLRRIEPFLDQLDSRPSRQPGGGERNEFYGSHFGLETTEVIYAQ